MRTALAVGFGWPRRLESGVAGLDLLAHGRLDFEAPDTDAFPCLRLAYAALEAGGTAPATLNQANEVAVSSFLQGRIGFRAVPALDGQGGLQGKSVSVRVYVGGRRVREKNKKKQE